MPGVIIDPVTGETFPHWSRSDWGARAPRGRNPLSSTREGVFIHHTVTSAVNAPAVLRGVQAWHMGAPNNWLDIAYSFAVGLAGEHDGAIFDLRGYGVQGGHTEGMNSHSHAVVLIGDTRRDPISERARRAVNCVIHAIEGRAGRQRVRCHGDVAATDCPGGVARSWVHGGRPTLPLSPPSSPPVEEDDMSIIAHANGRTSARMQHLLGPDQPTDLAFHCVGNTMRQLTGEEVATLRYLGVQDVGFHGDNWWNLFTLIDRDFLSDQRANHIGHHVSGQVSSLTADVDAVHDLLVERLPVPDPEVMPDDPAPAG